MRVTLTSCFIVGGDNDIRKDFFMLWDYTNVTTLVLHVGTLQTNVGFDF